MKKRSVDVAIIGSGPAGLMAASVLVNAGKKVEIFDSKPSFARKLLMAGKSGLNITKSEGYSPFVNRFSHRDETFDRAIESFSPKQVKAWCQSFGVETFKGTSGRVFPKVMKSSPLLRAWLAELSDDGATFSTRHRWVGFNEGGVQFATEDGPVAVNASATIFALGGGSWARLGSDGAWVKPFNEIGVEVAPFEPSNCGFECRWDPHFVEKFGGQPIKSVAAHVGDLRLKGDFVITRHGVEGGIIYPLAPQLRNGQQLYVDLKPDLSHARLESALAKPRGRNSLSNYLRKTIKLSGAKAGLLRMCAPDLDFSNVEALVSTLKKLPVPIVGPRPLDEAISTSGGVKWESLDDQFMVKARPGTFVAGEMIEWDAPTGGYLITACLATGKAAGEGALKFLGSDL